MGAANQNLCGTRGQYRVRLYAPANYSYGQLRIAKELARRKRCFPPLVLRCSSGGPPPGIPTLHGRALLETDRDGTPLVAVVNEHMANHYWKGDALGKFADFDTP